MAEEILAAGNAYLLAGNLPAAVERYSEVVAQWPDNALAYQKRAGVYNKLGKHREALEDCVKALQLTPDAAQAEANKGVSLFMLGDPVAARTAFARGLQLFESGKGANPANLGETIKSWLAKCEQFAGPAGPRPGTKDEDDEEEVVIKKKAPAAAAASAAAAPAAAAGGSAAASAGAVQTAGGVAVPGALRKPRYEWYQSATHVTLSFLVKEAAADKSSVVIGEDGRSLSVSLALPASDWVLDLDLYDEVKRGAAGQPDTLSIRPSKVEVRLAKGDGAQYMWPAVEKQAAAVPAEAVKAKLTGVGVPAAVAGGAASSAPQPVPAAAAAAGGSAAPSRPAYPTSSGKKKDWNALEKELEKEEEGKAEGEEALMKLFRQIYGNADENTRRAMVKSYQTSGGTVLSTNWKEVEKADYEKDIKAPEGMVAKKWGED